MGVGIHLLPDHFVRPVLALQHELSLVVSSCYKTGVQRLLEYEYNKDVNFPGTTSWAVTRYTDISRPVTSMRVCAGLGRAV